MSPGPPPKAPGTRARRNAGPTVVYLPAAGRQEPPPPWPLVDDVRLITRLKAAGDKVAALRGEMGATDDKRTLRSLGRALEAALLDEMTVEAELAHIREAEAALWSDLWATPQAEVWERSHSARVVALYVRWTIKGEMGDLDAGKESRLWSDRLGLSPLAMLRLRFEIERTDEAVDRGNRRRGQPPAKALGTDPRLKLVE